MCISSFRKKTFYILISNQLTFDSGSFRSPRSRIIPCKSGNANSTFQVPITRLIQLSLIIVRNKCGFSFHITKGEIINDSHSNFVQSCMLEVSEFLIITFVQFVISNISSHSHIISCSLGPPRRLLDNAFIKAPNVKGLT